MRRVRPLFDELGVQNSRSRSLANAEWPGVAESEDERRYRYLAEGSLQGVIVLRRGRLLFANEAFAEIFGFDTAQQLLDLGNVDALLSDPAFAEACEAALTPGVDDATTRRQVHGIACDGQVIWLEMLARSVDWNGSVAVQITVNDITARRALTARLRELSESRAVTGVTTGLAGRFNNLLQVITGNLELLDREPGSQEERRRLEVALRNALRGADLVHRMISGTVGEPAVTDLGALLGDAQEILQVLLRRSVVSRFVVDDDVDAVLVDANRLTTILIHFALTAEQTLPGPGTVTVVAANEATTDDATPMVRISFAAAGADLDVDAWAAAMHEQPGDAATVAGADRLCPVTFAADMGGTVGFAETVDEDGPRVTVTLHLPGAVAATMPGDAGQHRATAGSVHGTVHGTVLLVEDNDDVRDLLAYLLGTLGLEVIAASTGKEALTLLDIDDKIDLLFTDIVMPGGISGIDLADICLSRRPDLKVIFTTGHSDTVIATPADGVPVPPVLRKPYSNDMLTATLSKVLGISPENAGLV